MKIICIIIAAFAVTFLKGHPKMTPSMSNGGQMVEVEFNRTTAVVFAPAVSF